jgi:hypothetical protein
MVSLFLSSIAISKELSPKEQAITMANYWAASLQCSFLVMPEDGLKDKHIIFFDQMNEKINKMSDQELTGQNKEYFSARKSELRGMTITPTECLDLYYSFGGK